jgi:hypothetical protein
MAKVPATTTSLTASAGAHARTCHIHSIRVSTRACWSCAGVCTTGVGAGPGRCSRRAAFVGQDSRAFAGHSLRAGLATSAAAGGATERDIMQQTRYRSFEMVRRYIRDGELFHTCARTSARSGSAGASVDASDSAESSGGWR